MMLARPRFYIGRPCRYCGARMHGRSPNHYRAPTREHLVPSRFRVKGEHSVTIIVCRACNSDKGGQTLGEWLAELIAYGDPRAERVRNVLDQYAAEIEAATERGRRSRPAPHDEPIDEIIASAEGAR